MGQTYDMIVHGNLPFNAEASRAALAPDDITPADAFYTRNHGLVPDIGTKDSATVSGLVDRTLTLDFHELTTGFAASSVVATLQCAGNRRAGFTEVRPIPGEDLWGPGATSTAEWYGVRLSDVLARGGCGFR